jgi:hypothetical protein
MGAKVDSQKGNSPRLFNKVFNINFVVRIWINIDSHKIGLEAAIFLRKRNSSLT